MKFGGVGFVCVYQSLLSYVFSGCIETKWLMVMALHILNNNHDVIVWLLLLSS